jgi:hypothetical protein
MNIPHIAQASTFRYLLLVFWSCFWALFANMGAADAGRLCLFSMPACGFFEAWSAAAGVV